MDFLGKIQSILSAASDERDRVLSEQASTEHWMQSIGKREIDRVVVPRLKQIKKRLKRNGHQVRVESGPSSVYIMVWPWGRHPDPIPRLDVSARACRDIFFSFRGLSEFNDAVSLEELDEAAEAILVKFVHAVFHYYPK